MKRWLLLGAGGEGTGALILARAQGLSRDLVALVRRDEAAQRLQAAGVTVVQGDARDEQAVREACALAGAGALVISTIGGGQEYQAHRLVIDAAEQCQFGGMILVTSIGCGDSWPQLSPRAKAAFGQAVREKTLAEAWLQTSTLAHVIVRPGGLLNGEASGKAQLLPQTGVHGLVRRADVADMVCQLAERPLTNQIYSLIEPDLRRN